MILTDYVASAGSSDYNARSVPLTFTANSNDGDTRCIDINILDDMTFEGDETFTVRLAITTPGVMEGNAMTTIIISDNEGMYALLSLATKQCTCSSFL